MSDITPGYTFVNGEKNVTHVKLNSLVGNATINSSFIDLKTSAVPPGSATTVYSDGSGTLRKTLIGNLVNVASLGTGTDGSSLIQGQTGNTWNLYRLKVDPSTLTLTQETNDLKLTVIASGSPGAHTVQGEATAPGTGAIALATISNANIASATLTGSLIANSTITGGLIASATITGSNIAATTLTGGGTSGNIASGAISSYNTTVPIIQTFRGYNALDNGDMSVWQTGTSFASVANGARTSDRWFVGKAGTMAATVSQLQVNFLPSGANAAYGVPNEFCTRVACTTAEASLGAGDYFFVQQTITGNRAMPLWGYTTSVGLWVRSSITGTFAVALRSSNSTASAVQTFTIGSTATWTYCTFPSFPAFPEGSTGSGWNHGNSNYYILSICLASGSTFQAPSTNTWSANNYVSASGQSNWMSSTSNTFDFMLVQHEPVIEAAGNDVTTPYSKKAFPQEYYEAQRYYTQSYPYGVSAGGNSLTGICFNNISSTVSAGNASYPVRMVGTGTTTIYHPTSGTVNSVRDVGAGSAQAITGSARNSDRGFSVLTASSTLTAGGAVEFHYVNDTGI